MVLETAPSLSVDEWEMHSEWPRLTMWLGGRPDLALIKWARDSDFHFMMDDNGMREGAVPFEEIPTLTIKERRTRRAYRTYFLYGLESIGWNEQLE